MMSVLSNVSIPSQGSSTNLCWAAVTIGVCASLGDPRRSLSAVATKFLPGCQGDLTTDACNHSYDVDAAIIGYGHSAVSTGGQLDLADLQHQIDDLSRPVPVIMMYPFTNHACLIKGYIVINGVPQVVLLNPSDAAPSDTYYDFAAFCDGSAISGVKWVDSYLVS
jgi:hypothetical protein